MTAGTREFFPNMYMALLSVRYLKSPRPTQAVFKVAPSMTKNDIQEYLRKIYGLPVKKVMTANFDGKWKRLTGQRKLLSVRATPRFKKAYVTFDNDANVM